MRLHHTVLLALAAPIFAVGVVLWFLLPGSVAGLTYTPTQFDQDATLRPVYWTGHDVTLRGYLHQRSTCSGSSCLLALIMSDAPETSSRHPGQADPSHDVEMLPQRESGFHSVMRRLLPQIVSSPIGARDVGKRVTVTGRLVAGYAPGQVPVIRPNSL